MSTDNFIPTVWSDEILETLNTEHVYGNAVNTDYEGDIRNLGDQVKINSIGRVTIRNYVKGTPLVAAERLQGAQQTLRIDRAKYFNFMVDDVDAAQQSPKLRQFGTDEAMFGLADATDVELASSYVEVAAGNLIGTDGSPIVPTADTAYEYLVDLDVILTENNVPRGGRFAIVPAFFEGLLRKDDRFVGFGTDANRRDLTRGGPIGTGSGFTVHVSNNAPNTAGALYKILAGYKGAISYAEQIAEGTMQAYSPELEFGDALKGLHISGKQVTRPNGIALLTVNKS